jgi:hypothetical protein
MSKKMPSKKILAQLQKAAKHYREMMARDGFAIHAIIGETTHTHGLEESFNHPEIECVLYTSPDLLISLVHDLGMRVKGGTRFSDGELVDKLLQDLPVKLVACADGLRLILPDPAGELEQDRMEPAYARQYDGLDVSRDELMEVPSSDPKFRN